MKIIIVGCGKVGTTLAEQLNKENHDIVIIDKNAGVVNSISERIDVMGVVGNGAVNKVQMEAGIEDTDLLIATTNSDELNMLCCLIAKKAGNCHTIARIRNPEYDSQISCFFYLHHLHGKEVKYINNPPECFLFIMH